MDLEGIKCTTFSITPHSILPDLGAHVPIANAGIVILIVNVGIIGSGCIIITSAVLELASDRGPEFIMKCLELTRGRGELKKTFLRVMLPETATIINIVISTILVTLPPIAFSLVGPAGPGPSIIVVLVAIIVLIILKESG